MPKANSGGGGAGGKTYFTSTSFTITHQSGGSSNLSSLGNLTGTTLYHGYDGGTGIVNVNNNYKMDSGGGGGAGSSGNNGSAGDGVLVNILGVELSNIVIPIAYVGKVKKI